MVAERENIEIRKECKVFEYGGAFRLNSANCKKNNLIKKKQIFKRLPNLQETLITVQSFQSKYHKIGVKLKRYTP